MGYFPSLDITTSNALQYSIPSPNNVMIDKREIIAWCRANNWTEPRELEKGIWVAFPPNGVIENLIPHQSSGVKKTKFPVITWFVHTPLLLFCMLVVTLASICITPFFFFIDRKKNHI